jgi:hypothetical protein
MRKTLLFFAILALSTISRSQSAARPEILILGTYHMDNPGRDVVNMQADDVLAPKRQQEIEQLVEVLKKFHPTKIALESDVSGERAAHEYSEYVAGVHLSRSETNQIGYRLAKELGHKTVYAVDEEGDFPWGRLVNYAKANGVADKFNSATEAMGKQVEEQGEFLRSHTVLEMYEYLNSDSMSAAGVAFYYSLVPYGDPGDYAGPDLLAAWYQRNIRIYHNIVKLIDSPNEKILVIFGAGHLGWLQQNAANDATVKLRKLAEFTEQR